MASKVSDRKIFDGCTLHGCAPTFTKCVTRDVPQPVDRNVGNREKSSSTSPQFAAALGRGTHCVDEGRAHGMPLEHGDTGRRGATW